MLEAGKLNGVVKLDVRRDREASKSEYIILPEKKNGYKKKKNTIPDLEQENNLAIRRILQ